MAAKPAAAAGPPGKGEKAAQLAARAAGAPQVVANKINKKNVKRAGKMWALGLLFPIIVVGAIFMLVVSTVNVTVGTTSNQSEADRNSVFSICGLASSSATVDSVWATYGSGPVSNAHGLVSPEKQQQIEVAIHALAEAGFAGDLLVTIASIAGRESNYNPRVLNDNPRTGDLSYGLFQLNMIGDLGPYNRARFGISTNEELWDPYVSGRSARILFDASPGVPFFAWGPYKGEAPLWGGADRWVPEVVRIATAMGYLDLDGNPQVPDPATLPAHLTGGAGQVAGPPAPPGVDDGTGGALVAGCAGILEGPNCDGLTGRNMPPTDVASLVSNEWINQTRPEAAAAWQLLVEAAIADGIDPATLKGQSYGPRPNAPSSVHPHGYAIDIGYLVGPWGQRFVDGEPHPVSEAFFTPTFIWLYNNSWKFGWCSPRNNRPYMYGGTATGGTYADGSFAGLEPWHFEFMVGTTEKFQPIYGDQNGPNGVADG